MAVASVKFDHEITATSAGITCSKIGCRRPVRPQIMDETFLPCCDEHQGLIGGPERWGVHSTQEGWLVDVDRQVFSFDAEACRQWGTPEAVQQDLDAAGLTVPLAFAIRSDGSAHIRTGLLVLRMR